MLRHFYILSAADGKCAVKEVGAPRAKEFSDTVGAIAFIRREAPGERVQITFFDPEGKVLFTRSLCRAEQ